MIEEACQAVNELAWHHLNNHFWLTQLEYNYAVGKFQNLFCHLILPICYWNKEVDRLISTIAQNVIAAQLLLGVAASWRRRRREWMNRLPIYATIKLHLSSRRYLVLLQKATAAMSRMSIGPKEASNDEKFYFD